MKKGETEVDAPKYLRVFEELLREITAGKYGPGQKLPSEAALEKRFGTSRITVGRAVRELQQKNFVERRAGSGTYVTANRLQGLSFGLLIPDLGRSDIFEPICRGMADAPQAADHVLLWGAGARPDIAATRQEQAWRLCQQFVSRQVSGVFFAPLEDLEPGEHMNHRIIDTLEKARIPTVLLDRDFLPYPERSQHDLIGINNRRTGYRLTDHLLKLGSMRVVFLTYPKAASTVGERIAGYREALFIHGIDVDGSFVQCIDPENRAAVQKMVTALAPDAFVCANDRTAGLLMQNLLALGYRIPQEMRIVGVDDAGYAKMLPVPLTTMHQPCREIGLAAMSAMMERLSRSEMPPRDILLECTLVVRQSCGGE